MAKPSYESWLAPIARSRADISTSCACSRTGVGKKPSVPEGFPCMLSRVYTHHKGTKETGPTQALHLRMHARVIQNEFR
eukprot:5905681-Pleurochrysis_carterae.AAC.1